MSDFDDIDYSAYESSSEVVFEVDEFDVDDTAADSFGYELSEEVMDSWPDGGSGDAGYSSDLSSEIIDQFPDS